MLEEKKKPFGLHHVLHGKRLNSFTKYVPTAYSAVLGRFASPHISRFENPPLASQEVKLQCEAVIGATQYRMKTEGLLENDGVAWVVEGNGEGKEKKGSEDEKGRRVQS